MNTGRTEPAVRKERGRRIERLIAGAASGMAAWFLAQLVGVPQLAGLGVETGVFPLAAAGALLSLTRFRSAIPGLAIALLIVAMTVGGTNVVIGPARELIRTDRLPASADAVVALSAGLSADGYLSRQALDRTLSAIELVKNAVAPVLVITHEERKVGLRIVDAGQDQRRLASLAGVTRVMSVGTVRSTRDEAVAVAELAKKSGWKRIVLVTSPFHSRRACRTFEKVGLKVSCIPSESRDIAVRSLAYPGDRLSAFGMLIYETAGTLLYKERGWL
ncbi:MAG: YdcF family protein [Gemmatimonadaceae bacterium]